MSFKIQRNIRKSMIALVGMLSAVGLVKPVAAENAVQARVAEVQKKIQAMQPAVNAVKRPLLSRLQAFADSFANTWPGFANSFANAG